MMEDDMNNFCLVDLYEGDSCDVLTLLETSPKEFLEGLDKWNNAIYSHIDRVLFSTRNLKLDTLGTDLDWLNTGKPLFLDADLNNRVIVLDFFTYCCINCEHSLPYVQEVEVKFETYPELVVIGVHSPKFPNEKALDSVKNAVLRNKIKHPVINDPENFLWKKLGVYCWPTVLIISPSHHVLFSLVGEMQIKKLHYLCDQTLNYLNMRNMKLNKETLSFNLLDEHNTADTLLYPSGIATYGTSTIISDTGHNRLLLLSSNGKVLDIIGNGDPCLNDGFYASSSFNCPHGIAWWTSKLVFVADTGNHCIRMIDVEAKTVSTIFKVNELGVECNENSLHNFASPWDVCLGPEPGSDLNELNVLYIAVSGSHQIWSLYLENSVLLSCQYSALKCIPFAGNGKEECRNNTYKMKAGFAQPSGISYSKLWPGILFIADSESSTVRSLSLIDGSVKTIVGGGLDPKDLFQYGDEDGVGYNVKLQHPLGICVVDEGKIFITDTYNHKIKLIDRSRKCSTVVGCGIEVIKRLESEFDEPSGICYLPLKKLLLVTDTNNHCVKVIDPEKKTIELMQIHFSSSSCIDGLRDAMSIKVLPPSVEPVLDAKILSKQDSKCSKIKLMFGGKICCSFKLVQSGMSLTKGALQPWNLSFKGNCNWNVTCVSNTLFDPSVQPSLILKCTDDGFEVHHSEILISANLTVCDDINKICQPKKFETNISVDFSSDGSEIYNGIFHI